MEEKKSGRFSDIRATAFDAVVIMRQIGNPGVLESLTNVKDTISSINEIIKELKTPEMIKNIENFRMISENINEASAKMQHTIKDLKETGVIDKASGLIDSAKNKVDSFGTGKNGLNNEDIHNIVTSTREMFGSIKDLADELKDTANYCKKSQTVSNVQETIRGVSQIH